MAVPKKQQQLRFPILQNIDYFDVFKNKTQITSFNGSQLEDKKWRDVSLMIGKITGQGLFRYSFKFKNSDEIHNGSIRGIDPGNDTSEHKTDSRLKSQIDELSNKVERLTNSNSGGIGIELLISVTKQSYETQITFLNSQLSQKDLNINKLETKIDELNNELDLCYQQIEDLKGQTGISSYLEIAKKFLDAKLPGKQVEKISLKDSNPSDIPESILNLLGVVDWNQVDPHIINEIVKYLNMFIPQLPKKGV